MKRHRERRQADSSVDRELVRHVRRIVSGLEPLTREAFLLSCLAERSYEEIGEWLGIPVDEVERRLGDAIIAVARGTQGGEQGNGSPDL
jgi:DNA-directed RNA polymerase specialized sigma24 family protein